MSFSSLSFIFFLLPMSFVLHWLAGLSHKIKYRNAVLLVMSVIFYGWCGIQYLILLFVMVCVNYAGIKVLDAFKKKKQWFVGMVVVDILVLVFFKYFNFFVENIERVVRMFGDAEYTVGVPLIPFPLGISFFTFQMIAVLADVYRGEAKVNSFLDFALFITFFPQLIEGPIVRYHEMADELKERQTMHQDLECGTRRFIVGFAKKVLIADRLNGIVNVIFGMTQTGIPLGYAWLGAICYAFVIYFDFSGYSDMAIGLCRIFGFRITENFNYPYISKSIQEFWRRWHISLSCWFRDYVYIALGGNRKGTLCTYRNLFIIFLLTGIWHGANWTFIAWGVFHGIFMMAEHAGLKKMVERLPTAVGHIYSLVVVLVGWVLFRADSIGQAFAYIKSMFIPVEITYRQIGVLSQFNGEVIFVLVIACLFSTPVAKKLDDRMAGKREYEFGKNFAMLLIFVMALSTMMSSAFSPSIYTKF